MGVQGTASLELLAVDVELLLRTYLNVPCFSCIVLLAFLRCKIYHCFSTTTPSSCLSFTQTLSPVVKDTNGFAACLESNGLFLMFNAACFFPQGLMV